MNTEGCFDSQISDPMSMVEDGRSLAGYTLDDVLANNRLGPPATARATEIRGRTLLDIIRDEEPSAGKGLFGKDKRTWKSFRDKLRLKRAGSAWVSTVPIPTSDIPVQTKRSLIGRRNQIRFNTGSSKNSTDNHSRHPSEESSKSTRRQMSRQTSTMNSSSDSSAFHYDESSEYSSSPDAAPVRIMRPQMSRHNSVRVSNPMENYTDPTEPDRDNRIRHSNLSDHRMMSAREAVAAQEAADAASAAAAAAAAAAEAAEEEKKQNENNNLNGNENEKEESTTGSEGEEESSPASEPVRMSLMDLLHETDREMGFERSSYGMGFEENFFEDDEDDEYEEDEDNGNGGEFSCCVCMVKHKNAPLADCGHTFCRLCSKELMVSRGNCPTCSNFILEILDAF